MKFRRKTQNYKRAQKSLKIIINCFSFARNKIEYNSIPRRLFLLKKWNMSFKKGRCYSQNVPGRWKHSILAFLSKNKTYWNKMSENDKALNESYFGSFFKLCVIYAFQIHWTSIAIHQFCYFIPICAYL